MAAAPLRQMPEMRAGKGSNLRAPALPKKRLARHPLHTEASQLAGVSHDGAVAVMTARAS